MIWLIAVAILFSDCRQGGDEQYPRTASQPAAAISGADQVWAHLLDCSTAPTLPCEKFLADTAAGSGIHKDLAVVLLEDRAKLPSDPTRMRARLVWIPLLSFEELTSLVPAPAHVEFVLVSGVVQPGGTVEGARLLRASEYEGLNAAILDAFSQARYRPARDKAGDFVSQRVEYVYRLEPR